MMTQGDSELSDFEYKCCLTMSCYTKAKVTKTTLNINASKLYYIATPTLLLTLSLTPFTVRLNLFQIRIA